MPSEGLAKEGVIYQGLEARPRNLLAKSLGSWRKLPSVPKRNLIWIVAIVAGGLVTLWVTRENPPQVSRIEPDEFDNVSETYRLIQEEYYRPARSEELRRGAVNGMVSVLDKFSSYVPADKLRAFESRMMGIGRGLGLRLIEEHGRIRVIGPLLNSPAHKAGIFAGDVILAIDGKKLAGLPLGVVKKMLHGPLGTSVKLTIERRHAPPKTFSLRRREFPLESVEGLYRDASGQWVHLVEPDRGLAYIRIKEFVHDTGRTFQELLRRLGSFSGLILDLRDNPGGMFPAGVEVANLFLDEGVIATSIGPNRIRQQYKAQPHGTLPEFPVVVLINADTASAAEIVAGALRLHGRAVLVGARTRGKGCVQSMFRLPGGLGQINLTTSELLIGKRQPIVRAPDSNVWGVSPHPGQEIDISPKQQEKLRRLRQQTGVLPPPKPPITTTARATTPKIVRPLHRKFLKLDPQFKRALQLLSRPREMEKILSRAATTRPAEELPDTRRAKGSQ